MMHMSQDQEVRAERLLALTQRVGFTVWQLQELEGATAQYFVMVCQATQGMGEESGQTLVNKAKSKTFGATITQLAKAKQLDPDTQTDFQTLLAERNWLVHHSRADSRSAIHDEKIFHKRVERIDAIADAAQKLIKSLGRHAETFARDHGISLSHIDDLTAQTLATWHS